MVAIVTITGTSGGNYEALNTTSTATTTVTASGNITSGTTTTMTLGATAYDSGGNEHALTIELAWNAGNGNYDVRVTDSVSGSSPTDGTIGFAVDSFLDPVNYVARRADAVADLHRAAVRALVACLREKFGQRVEIRVWSEPHRWDAAREMVVIRSVWDYQQRLDEFLRWLDLAGVAVFAVSGALLAFPVQMPPPPGRNVG